MRSQETRGLTLAAVKKWPPTVSVTEAARALGVSRASAYTAISAGEFPVATIQVNQKRRVLTASLIAVLEGGGQRAASA
jgi:hypothetical protein